MSANAVALRAYYFLSIAAMGVFLPFLPAWLDARGVGGWGIGLISAMRPFAGIFVPALFGVLADMFRQRGSLLRIACAGAVVCTGLITLSVWLADPGLIALSLLFGVMSVFRAPMNTLADVTALETKIPFGRLRLWGSVGFFLSALAAGYLVDPRLAVPLPLTMLVLLTAALGMSYVLPPRAAVPPQPVWTAARELMSSSDYQLFLGGVFLWGAAHCAYDLSITLHLGSLGASNGFVGWTWAIGTIAEVALMAYCAPWIERHGPTRLMFLGVSIATVRWSLLAVIQSPAVLLLLQPLHAGSFALVFVSGAAFLKQRAESHVLATAQASFALAMSLGGGLGMLGWGPLLKAAGGSTVFLGAAAVSLGSTLAMGILASTRRATRGETAVPLE